MFLVYGLGTSFDNVLLEHGVLPCVLPVAVYLDLGHFLGNLSDPCNPAWALKRCEVGGGLVGSW